MMRNAMIAGVMLSAALVALPALGRGSGGSGGFHGAGMHRPEARFRYHFISRYVESQAGPAYDTQGFDGPALTPAHDSRTDSSMMKRACRTGDRSACFMAEVEARK